VVSSKIRSLLNCSDYAGYIYQSLGRIPELCQPDGDFSQALNAFRGCASQYSVDQASALVTAHLDEALSYCNAVQGTTSTDALTSSANLTTTSTYPTTFDVAAAASEVDSYSSMCLSLRTANVDSYALTCSDWESGRHR